MNEPAPSGAGRHPHPLWCRLFPTALALAIAAAPHPTTAQPPNRAGLIVQLGDGSVRTFCIAFPEPSITGDVLLRRSGLEVRADVSALGTTVCRIDDTGCDHPREACWCRCRTLGAGCTYWGYNTLTGSRWDYSVLGAAARVVRDGDVDGWAWGQGAIATGAAPPVMAFEDVCASSAATASIRPPTPDPARSPPAGARRRRALASPTDTLSVNGAPVDTAPTYTVSHGLGSVPSGTAPAAIPSTDPPRTGTPRADVEPRDGAQPAPPRPDEGPTHAAPADRPPARRPNHEVEPTAPTAVPGTAALVSPPAAAAAAAADRTALAVYTVLVVALAAAGWWLRRAG